MKQSWPTILLAALYSCAYLSMYLFSDLVLAKVVAIVVTVFLVLEVVIKGRNREIPGLACLSIGIATAYFSGSKGSAGSLAQYLVTALNITPAVASALVFCIRKTIHITVYGALVATFVLYFRPAKYWSAGLAWGAIHAALDELHQSFSAVRSASLVDFAIDGIGMFLGLLIVKKIFEREGEKSCITSS